MPTEPETDIREDTPGYEPPEGPGEHQGWWLALKFAVACTLVALIARAIGFTDPTTGIISSAFLVANGPLATVRTALVRFGGLFIGAGLGVAGAYWGMSDATDGAMVPILFFTILAAVTGLLAAREPGLMYVTVIGTVVATVGVAGRQPVPEVAVQVGLLIAISCVVGPTVVWAAEKLRAHMSARRP